MILVRTIADTRRVLDPLRVTTRLGFVPTMGALHDGHTSLFRVACGECGAVAASVFVNPTQFNDPADLAAYPRSEARDTEIAEAAGIDVLFVPPAEEIYRPGRATTVEPAGAALGYEGDHRPGHFAGVALVCAKLFNIVAPHVVYLGQKDAQQVAVLRQTVRDLDQPVEIRVVPTLRDPDGLAMSSRNVRLSPEERTRALAIPRALRAGLAAHTRGLDPAAAARDVLEADRIDLDYVGVAAFGEPTLVIAARLGRTRLIDNVPLDDPARAGLGVRGTGGPEVTAT
jgi:pantoate--beta-alanine ligase